MNLKNAIGVLVNNYKILNWKGHDSLCQRTKRMKEIVENNTAIKVPQYFKYHENDMT